MPPSDFKDLVEGWLARASNPATGMDVKLRTAQEKILKLEHKTKEERKISELKQQEDTIQAEKLEKGIHKNGKGDNQSPGRQNARAIKHNR